MNNELEGFDGIPDELKFEDLLTKDFKESKVGKKLSEFTTRRVIILVLAMLFSTPVLSVDQYLEEPINYNYPL